MNKTIAIFAGNSCTLDEQEAYFKLAYEMGKLLAREGFVTLTGGGSGLMDEASRGAFEAKGKTMAIGLNLKERKKSDYVSEITIFDQLGVRQDKLITAGDAYIALPGGIGTLYEIFNIIALKRLDEIPKERPLILLGDYFLLLKPVFDAMISNGLTEKSVYSLFNFAQVPSEAIELLKNNL